MLSKLLGVVWILTGLLWVARPGMIRNRLKRKMSRKLKRVVFGFVFVFGFLLVGSVMKAPGFLAKVIGIIGMVLAIKAIILITSKTSEKIFDWWAARPLGFFRIMGALMLVVGLMLMFV